MNEKRLSGVPVQITEKAVVEKNSQLLFSSFLSL